LSKIFFSSLNFLSSKKIIFFFFNKILKKKFYYNIIKIHFNKYYINFLNFLIFFFLKKKKSKLKNEDVHLIGVASMFISSKCEDLYHIPLKDIIERVAHNKFSG
jgi:hypothetical protein